MRKGFADYIADWNCRNIAGNVDPTGNRNGD